MAKVTGTVKWFRPDKHFGYITDDNGNDHFVHISNIEEGRTYTGFETGDRVEFNDVKSEKGLQAVNVKLIEKVEDINKDEASAAPAESTEA